MNCYVYLWFYPTGVPLYVGWGRWRVARKRQRYEDHLVGSRNRQLAAAFRRYGSDLPVVIIHDSMTPIEAKALEVALISAIGRTDLKTGPLANRTAGGDGLIDPPAEVRERISAAHRRRVHKPLTDEHKRKIGDANRGRLKTEEERHKIANSNRGRVRSPEFKAKVSATMTGRPLTNEHKLNVGNSLRGRVKGPQGPRSAETRAKMSESARRSMTPERRAVLSQRATAAWANPEIRERQSVTMRGPRK